MTLTLFARDLSTIMGWALRASNHRITSDTQSFKLQRLMSSGTRFSHAAIAQECAA